MSAATWTFIPDILEEHLEEVAFLWGQRRAALRSPEYTPRSVADLEERIAAHVQGVVAVAADGIELVRAALASDDADAAFAGAFSLLHTSLPGAEQEVLEAFVAAEGDRLAALSEALKHAPLGPAGLGRLALLAGDEPSPRTAAAAEALAFHGALELKPDRLAALLGAEDAAVRCAGWRLVGYMLAPVDAKLYARALRDDEAAVRDAALLAGAWCGVQGVLPAARKIAAEPGPEHAATLYLLAVLGAPEDLTLFQRVAADPAFGPERFRLAAAYGHPVLVDAVLAGMTADDPAAAAAAGAAFLKLTGVDVFTGERAQAPVEGGDEFDAEFAEEYPVPDAERARREWSALAPQLGAATRICRGLDLGQPLDRASFDSLDMESRWELCLRGRFYGTWAGSPLALERFPLPR